jgi:hypothetical protein
MSSNEFFYPQSMIEELVEKIDFPFRRVCLCYHNFPINFQLFLDVFLSLEIITSLVILPHIFLFGFLQNFLFSKSTNLLSHNKKSTIKHSSTRFNQEFSMCKFN